MITSSVCFGFVIGEKNNVCFPFEWCLQRVGSWEKGRAAYRAGKNERCPVLGLPVGHYTYMAGGAKLLCVVACTELATQRNPVPEQRSSGIVISVFIGGTFYFKKWSDSLVPQLCSLPPFKWGLLWFLGCSKRQQFPGAQQAVCLSVL